MSERIELAVGLEEWTVEIPAARRIELHRPPTAPAGAGPRQLVRDALENPFGFEPLRRALTPDDHIVLVLDEQVPHAAESIAGVLEHLRSAGIGPDCVTILTPARAANSEEAGDAPFRLDERWIDELPDEFSDVKTEIHHRSDRGRLAYLAATKGGRRIYLNRTLTEADFVVVLTRRGYDPVSGYGGAESAIYPSLSDEEAHAAYRGECSAAAPAEEPWPIRAEALEVAWLLGTPFFVQVIEGPGDSIAEVVAGLPDSSAEGIRRLNARWRGTVARKAETVIATISGDPRRLDFLALARAAECAARVVKSNGRIALLTRAAPELTPSADQIRTLGDPASAAKLLAKSKPEDGAAARLWCHVARKASLFLASEYPDEFAEELFATPVHGAAEVQRLIDSGGDVLVIPDAQKSMVTVLRAANSLELEE